MSTTTYNLGLIKLGLNDPADITQFNTNWEKIDTYFSCKFLTSSDNLNNITRPGYYGWNHNDAPIGVPNEDGTAPLTEMRVWKHGSGCVQELISQHLGANYSNCVMRRVVTGDNAEEWAWVNPPLMRYCEYRTTEKYKGEVVYIRVDHDGSVHKRTESGLDITPITYGTTELTEGTSELLSGQLKKVISVMKTV